MTVDEKGTIDTAGEGRIILGLIELSNAVRRNNFAKGWRGEGDDPRPIGDLIALLHSEVTEAFESYRNNEPPLWYEYTVDGAKSGPTDSFANEKIRTHLVPKRKEELGKPQGIASELADVIIRVLDMADELKMPLYEAVLDKHKYNQTRPYRHGGKVV